MVKLVTMKNVSVKTFTKLVGCILLTAPVLVVGAVSAQESTLPKPPGTSNTTNKQEGVSTTDVSKRVAERKAKMLKRLSQVEQVRVKAKCAVASRDIALLQTRSKVHFSNQAQRHARLLAKLQTLRQKLVEAGIDVANYDKQVVALQEKVHVYETEVKSFESVLADLSAMDCVSDPEGFVATMREAKLLRHNVVQKSLDIRSYIKNTLRPALVGIRDDAKINKQVQAKDPKER